MSAFMLLVAALASLVGASMASTLVQKMGAPIWAAWMTWLIVWAVIFTAVVGGCRR